MSKIGLTMVVLLAVGLSAALQPLNAVAGPTEGLVAYYPFDGHANDLSGFGNHGMEHGVISYQPGVFGEAAYFNGVNSYIRVPADPSLNPSNQITISFWIYVLTFTNDWSPIVHKGGPQLEGSSNREYSVWLSRSDRNLHLSSAGDGSGQVAQRTCCARQGQWTHYAAIIDRASHTVRIYVDGTLRIQAPDPYTTFNNNDEDLLIGWSEETHPNFSPFNGRLDELRIYNRALSEQEIKDLFLAGASLQQGLAAWWPLDGDAVDVSGNHNHGVVHGAVPCEDRFGNPSGAMCFDTGHYINIGNRVKPRFPFTMTAWLKPDTVADRNLHTMQNDAWSCPGWYYGARIHIINGYLGGAYGDGGYCAPWSRTGAHTQEPVAVAGEWQKVAVVFHAHRDMRLYWNCTEYPVVYNDGTGSAVQYSTANGAIGGLGALDDVRVYDRSLFLQEIAKFCPVTCPHEDHLVLENHTVTGVEGHTACRTLTAGPAFTVSASGDATFRAGERITLRPGFSVQAGGRFTAQIDPGLAIQVASGAEVLSLGASPDVASIPPTPSNAEVLWSVLWSQSTVLTWSDLPTALRARLTAQDAIIRDAQQSADGTVLVFATDTALLDADTNHHSDVYAYRVKTDTLELISQSRDGQAADAPSHSPRLDAAGHRVVFLSAASDLLPGPSNAYTQLYHHDLHFATTLRLTTTAAGRPGRGDTHTPLLAGDWAIYRTDAPDLAAAGAGIYRQHLHDGRRQAVGRDHWGQPDPEARHPAASADGELIAYQRPEHERWQILLNDLLSVERLSLLHDPVFGRLDHCCAALSADGRYLAYREQGEHGPAWLHLLDRDTDHYTRLPWPEDVQERAPQFSHDATELWWVNPEQGPGLPEVMQRVDNPLW